MSTLLSSLDLMLTISLHIIEQAINNEVMASPAATILEGKPGGVEGPVMIDFDWPSKPSFKEGLSSLALVVPPN